MSVTFVLECVFSFRDRTIRSTFAAAFLSIALLGGCAGIPQSLRQSLAVVVPHKVDFEEIEYYADRSYAAYNPVNAIRREFPQTTRARTIKSVDVQYFLETDSKRKTQTISVRGTANKPNVWQDIAIAMVKDNELNLRLHRGFRNDARKVHADIRGHVRKGYAIRVTGHSLGGAVAMILAGYLAEEGHDVQRLVTFGQPKVTDKATLHLLKGKVTRVAHDQDVVPMVPPTGLAIGLAGRYTHIGPELILRDGTKYVYLPEHDSERLSVHELWRNITNFSAKEHHMGSYLENIQVKIKNGTRQVPYLRLPKFVALQ